MAIAVNGGHVARALEFYHAAGKYFILGGTTPWEDESAPTAPSVSDYKLRDIIGLKRIDNIHLVIPVTDEEVLKYNYTNIKEYRNQKWKIVLEPFSTKVAASGVTEGSTVIPVESVASLTVGSKLRIASTYEGKIEHISGLFVTLDTPAPVAIPEGSKIEAGALIEEAKYVYLDCYLNYDQFPVIDKENNPLSYRQIGLCSGVTPNTENVLKAAAFTTNNIDEYTSLGILEVLDNRIPSTRDINQREQLSLIIEF